MPTSRRKQLTKKQKAIVAVLCVSGVLLGIGGLWLFFRKGKATVKLPVNNKPTTETEDGAQESQKEAARKNDIKRRDLKPSKAKKNGDSSSSEEEEENSQEAQVNKDKKVDSNPNTPIKVKNPNAPSIPLKKKKKVEKADIKTNSKYKGNDDASKDSTVADPESVKRAKDQANEIKEAIKEEIRAKLQKASIVEFSSDYVPASHLSLLTHEELVKLRDRVDGTKAQLPPHLKNSTTYVSNFMPLLDAIKYTATDYPYKDLILPWMKSDYRMYKCNEFFELIQSKSIPKEELKDIIAVTSFSYKMRVIDVKELSRRPEEYFEASLSKFVNDSINDPEFDFAWIPMIVQYCSVSSDEEVNNLVTILEANSVLKKHAIEALKELKETNTSPNFFYKRIITS